MQFVRSSVLVLLAAVSASTSKTTSESVPACIKPCIQLAQKGTNCAAADLGCIFKAEKNVLETVTICAAAKCKENEDLGRGIRALISVHKTVRTREALFKRTIPGHDGTIDEEACKRCEDSKHQYPPAPAPAPFPKTNTTSYPNGTVPGLLPNSTGGKRLPKAPTSAGNSVQASAVGLLGALAVLIAAF